MGGKSSPPPPDYTGAAQATATGNLDVARATAAANRVNQVTPFGNLTYTQNGTDQFGNPAYTATTSLSPDQQATLNANNRTSLGLSNLEQQGLGYVQNQLNSPFPVNALPSQTVDAGQTGQDALMARFQPMIDQQNAAEATKLQNQGVTPGSEAYNNEMRAVNQGQNDLRTQAALNGINVGNQARQQAIQEQSFFRNEPINTLNAVRTGAQVNSPTFTNVPQQGQVGGPDYLGATSSSYNAQLGAANAQNAQRAGTTQAAGQGALAAYLGYLALA